MWTIYDIPEMVEKSERELDVPATVPKRKIGKKVAIAAGLAVAVVAGVAVKAILNSNDTEETETNQTTGSCEVTFEL